MAFSASFRPDWLTHDADDLRVLLGPYATWLLSPESAPVDALTDPGVAVILLASDRVKAPALPDASLLPARWVRVASQPPGLPRELVRQAAEVVALLGKDFEGWKLSPLDDALGSMDLSALPVEGSSGFATLAASLAVAVGRGRTLPRVFATIGWSGQALRRVEGVAQKLDLINRLGPATVFVHPDDEAEARARASSSLAVMTCSSPAAGTSVTALKQLRPLLAKLGVRPRSDHDPLDSRIAAFNLVESWEDADRRSYYDRHIRDELCDLLRRRSEISTGRQLLLVYNPNNEGFSRFFLDLVQPSRVVAIRQTAPANDDDQLKRAKNFLDSARVPPAFREVASFDPDASDDVILEKIRGVEALFEAPILGYADCQNGTSFLKAIAVSTASRLGLTALALEQVWSGPRLLSSSTAKLQRFGFLLPP